MNYKHNNTKSIFSLKSKLSETILHIFDSYEVDSISIKPCNDNLYRIDISMKGNSRKWIR